MLKNNYMNFFKFFIVFVLLVFISCKRNENKNNENKQVKFNYVPKKPVNGTLKGVVELGSTGFNYFVIEIDSSKNWALKRLEYGKSFIAEGMTTVDEINRKLNAFIKELENIGVAKKDINFVVSSGAIKEEETKRIVEELRKIDHEIKVVSPEEEAIYGLKSVLPENYKKESFVVDLGSGNTKISYYKNNEIIAVETHGSKYHQKGIEDEQVYKDVKKLATSVPVENRKYCFLLGGVPAELAKSIKNKGERYTLLYANGNKFDEVAKEKGKRIVSGLNIYKAIVKSTNCKTLIFDWENNFAIGYLLHKEAIK